MQHVILFMSTCAEQTWLEGFGNDLMPVPSSQWLSEVSFFVFELDILYICIKYTKCVKSYD